MTTEFPFGVIAPVGHRSRQRVQPVIEERECAHSDGSKLTKRGLSKVPTRPPASAIARSTAARSRGSARRYPGRNSCAGNIGTPPERSRIRSQVEVAPSREGPNTSLAREDGDGSA